MRIHFIWSDLGISCCKNSIFFSESGGVASVLGVSGCCLFVSRPQDWWCKPQCLCTAAGTEIPLLECLSSMIWVLLLVGRLQTGSRAFSRGSVYYFSKFLFCLNLMDGFTQLQPRTLTNKVDIILYDRMLNMILPVSLEF